MKEKIRIRKTPYIRWISRISWVLLVIYMVWFVYRWRQLPQTVPLHFGFDGTPDRWGGKESLWMTPALALAVFAGLTVILRFPGIWNTGFKPVTEENREWVYQNLASMLVSVRLGAEVILMYSSWKGMTDYRMGGWFWLIWFAVLFGPVIFFTVRMSRPPENPGKNPNGKSAGRDGHRSGERKAPSAGKTEGTREDRWI